LIKRIAGKSGYYDYYSGLMFVPCSDKNQFEDVYLWIDGYKFEIKKDDYVIVLNDLLEEPDPEFEDECLFAIIDDFNPDYWLVGDAFLKGYYTIHDNDDHANAKIGFAPHATSTKQLVTAEPMPKESIIDVLWELNWIGMMVNPRFGLGIGKMFAKLWLWMFGIYPLFL
jgi:hypothetical protein